MKKVYFRLLKISIFLLFVSESSIVYGQTIGIGNIFRPGIRVGVDYTSDLDVEDPSYQFGRLKFNSIIPNKSKITGKLSLKDPYLSFSNSFFMVNASIRRQHYPLATKDFSSFSVGYTKLKASTSTGVWAYSGIVGVNQDLEDPSIIHPYALLAGGKVIIQNRKNIYFLGAGATYSYGQVLPFPILGMKTSLGRKMSLNVLLPMQVGLKKRLNKKKSIEFITALTSFNSPWLGDSSLPPTFSPNKTIIRNFGVKSSFFLNIKSSKKRKIFFEIGGIYGQSSNWSTFGKGSTHLADTQIPFQFITSLSIHFDLGNKFLSSQLFGIDF